MADASRSMGRVIVDMATLGHNISDDLRALFSDEALIKNPSIAALAQLLVEGPHRPVDLLPAAGLSRGGLSKVIDQLESAGLVERYKNEEDPDGRSVYVRLTGKGARLSFDMVEIMGRRIRPFVESASRILATE